MNQTLTCRVASSSRCSHALAESVREYLGGYATANHSEGEGQLVATSPLESPDRRQGMPFWLAPRIKRRENGRSVLLLLAARLLHAVRRNGRANHEREPVCDTLGQAARPGKNSSRRIESATATPPQICASILIMQCRNLGTALLCPRNCCRFQLGITTFKKPEGCA